MSNHLRRPRKVIFFVCVRRGRVPRPPPPPPPPPPLPDAKKGIKTRDGFFNPLFWKLESVWRVGSWFFLWEMEDASLFDFDIRSPLCNFPEKWRELFMRGDPWFFSLFSVANNIFLGNRCIPLAWVLNLVGGWLETSSLAKKRRLTRMISRERKKKILGAEEIESTIFF